MESARLLHAFKKPCCMMVTSSPTHTASPATTTGAHCTCKRHDRGTGHPHWANSVSKADRLCARQGAGHQLHISEYRIVSKQRDNMAALLSWILLNSSADSWRSLKNWRIFDSCRKHGSGQQARNNILFGFFFCHTRRCTVRFAPGVSCTICSMRTARSVLTALVIELMNDEKTPRARRITKTA